MSKQFRPLAFVLLVFALCLSLFGLVNWGSVQPAQAESNGLALTPPMGWNSWNHFKCTGLNENVVKAEADAMASNGMMAAGYKYINLDDCWAGSRDSNGNIVADPTSFPSGIKALADYVHGKGLKLGIYSDRGTQTCALRPGSQGHEQQDANSYASWGVDYLKYDNCHATLDKQTQYTTMSNALKNSGRGIVFSICSWSFMSWQPSVGNLSRTTGDISDNWSSMISRFDTNSQYASYAGPGYWNDPDMLEVGNGGMTAIEDQTHFALWAISAAPLITGNDISTMSTTAKTILTNAEVIAVDQDPMGKQGTKVSEAVSGLQVWAKPVKGTGANNYAIVLLNRNGSAANITVKWSSVGLSGSMTLRDLINHTNLGNFTNSYTANVASHGVVMIRISPTAAGTPTFVPPTFTPAPTKSYEAESSSNTLGGGAAIANCTNCSGGQRVRYVGNASGTLTFNGVTGSASQITVYFVNGGTTTRNAQIRVNGGSPITVTFGTTGDWNTPGSQVVKLSLISGSNTIEFSNDTSGQWGPDFDKISVP